MPYAHVFGIHSAPPASMKRRFRCRTYGSHYRILLSISRIRDNKDSSVNASNHGPDLHFHLPHQLLRSKRLPEPPQREHKALGLDERAGGEVEDDVAVLQGLELLRGVPAHFGDPGGDLLRDAHLEAEGLAADVEADGVAEMPGGVEVLRWGEVEVRVPGLADAREVEGLREAVLGVACGEEPVPVHVGEDERLDEAARGLARGLLVVDLELRLLAQGVRGGGPHLARDGAHGLRVHPELLDEG